MLGAPGSCLGSALPLTQEPFMMIWVTATSSVNVNVQPLLRVTEDCAKLLSVICTVGQLLVLLELLLDELPPELAVGVPGRWQATRNMLPNAKAIKEKMIKRMEDDFICELPLSKQYFLRVTKYQARSNAGCFNLVSVYSLHCIAQIGSITSPSTPYHRTFCKGSEISIWLIFSQVIT